MIDRARRLALRSHLRHGLAVGLGLSLLAAPAVRAQMGTPPQLDPSIAFGAPRLSLQPVLRTFDGQLELGFSGALSWTPPAAESFAFRLEGMALRGRQRSWAGAGAALRLSGETRHEIPFLEAASWLGTGDGARAALELRAGTQWTNIDLELRTAWWRLNEYESIVEPESRLSRADLFGTASRATDAVMRVRFDRWVAAALTGGHRFGVESDSWLHFDVGVPVREGIALVLSAGRRPADPARGEPRGSFVGIGARLFRPPPATQPRARPEQPMPLFAMEATGPDAWYVTVRAPATTSVEITGDLTAWVPVALDRSSTDEAVWHTRVRAAPGTYTIALRIDGGAWFPPPGLPAVPDGFGGRAGLIDLGTLLRITQEVRP